MNISSPGEVEFCYLIENCCFVVVVPTHTHEIIFVSEGNVSDIWVRFRNQGMGEGERVYRPVNISSAGGVGCAGIFDVDIV